MYMLIWTYYKCNLKIFIQTFLLLPEFISVNLSILYVFFSQKFPVIQKKMDFFVAKKF